jgi:hypothetical protein
LGKVEGAVVPWKGIIEREGEREKGRFIIYLN